MFYYINFIIKDVLFRVKKKNVYDKSNTTRSDASDDKHHVNTKYIKIRTYVYKQKTVKHCSIYTKYTTIEDKQYVNKHQQDTQGTFA